MAMLGRNLIKGHLEIQAQPLSRYGFRYASAGVRGPLRSSAPDFEWPTVHLLLDEIPKTSGTFIMLCFLVKEYADSPRKYFFSANTLRKCIEQRGHQDFDPIQTEMKQLQANLFSFQLENYYINKTKRKDISTCLENKYMSWCNNFNKYGHMDMLMNKDQEIKEFVKHDEIRLGFAAYFYDGNTYQKVGDNVYSQLIYNSSSIVRINLCCNYFLSVDGEMNVHLLLSDVQFDYKIRIRTTDGSWQSDIIGLDKSLLPLKAAHKMLAFPVPAYRNKNIHGQTPVQCKLTLYDENNVPIEGAQVDVVYVRFIALTELQETIGDDDDMMRDMELYMREDMPKHLPQGGKYLIDFLLEKHLKDPKVSESFDNLTGADAVRRCLLKIGQEFSKAAMQAASEYAEIWDKVMKIDEMYKLWCGNMHTSVFHDAIKLGQLAEMRQAFANVAQLERLAQLRAGRNRTLLHWLAMKPEICSSNDARWWIAKCAVPALGMLTIQGNTYLHIAVDQQNIPMLRGIRECLSDSRLKQLLSIYNMSGYTALHKCILKGKTESLKWLLDVYGELQENACQVRVLGAGLTPMHLVVQAGALSPCKKILLDKINDAENYLNYAGYDAYGNYRLGNVEEKQFSNIKMKSGISNSEALSEDYDSDDYDDQDKILRTMSERFKMSSICPPVRN